MPELEQGWLNYHLARALCMRGDLTESEEQCHLALSSFEERSDLWSSSYVYDLLSQVRMKQERFEEAPEMSQKAWDLLLPQLGSEHMDMGHILLWRGNIYRAMGEEEKAHGCYTQAIDIFKNATALHG